MKLLGPELCQQIGARVGAPVVGVGEGIRVGVGVGAKELLVSSLLV